MRRYFIFLVITFVLANAIYLYGSFEFLFNLAPYYISGIIVLGIIVFFFRKKYGLSLMVIGMVTFISGKAIISYQESISHENAVKTIAIIENYKIEQGNYPSEFQFKELSLPKTVIGFIPHNFNYALTSDSYILDYPLYHGYKKYYYGNSSEWIISD